MAIPGRPQRRFELTSAYSTIEFHREIGWRKRGRREGNMDEQIVTWARMHHFAPWNSVIFGASD
jgi:hypothetical protein